MNHQYKMISFPDLNLKLRIPCTCRQTGNIMTILATSYKGKHECKFCKALPSTDKLPLVYNIRCLI